MAMHKITVVSNLMCLVNCSSGRLSPTGGQ